MLILTVLNNVPGLELQDLGGDTELAEEVVRAALEHLGLVEELVICVVIVLCVLLV